MNKKKCIIMLSEKSSGSSALQNLLTDAAQVKHVRRTRHFENETLYWTKAASILQMPQMKAIDSEVPIEHSKARQDLVEMLKENVSQYAQADNDEDLIFEGWRSLCDEYKPIFLEKSPHHIFQWSAIELIVKCMQRLNDVDFLLIGMIRSPMDTIYSQFKRWKTRPEDMQKQWFVSYKNLLKLKEIVGQKLVLLRYEDMVTSANSFKEVLSFCGTDVSKVNSSYLHQKSVAKWKNDKKYSFNLSDENMSLAEQFGYKRSDLINSNKNVLWPIYREYSRIKYKQNKRRKIANKVLTVGV